MIDKFKNRKGRLKETLLTIGVGTLMVLGVGHALRAGSFQGSSQEVNPSGVTGGGEDGLTSTSNKLNNTMGEVGQSTFTSLSYELHSGLMNTMSFPGSVTGLAPAAKSSTTINLSWSAPGYDGNNGDLQPGTTYYIQNSTDPSQTWNFTSAQVLIATQSVSPGDDQSSTIPNLIPNTSYYFRLWTKDAEGNISSLSNGATDMTLTLNIQTLPNTFLNVFTSSVAVAWAALPPSPSSATSNGYQLQACSESDCSGLILSSSTLDVSLSTLTVRGLNSNTTYYFRVGSINDKADVNFRSVGSTKTHVSIDSIPPDVVNSLTASTVTATSMSLQWNAPFDPTDNPLNGNYAIQYATWTGVVWSTSNAQVLFSTSNVSPGDPQEKVVGGLNPNTTYYFKLWTSDLKPNWSEASNQAAEGTLAKLMTNISFDAVLSTGVSLNWDAFPSAPQSDSADGYILQGSTTSNFTGTVQSSITTTLTQSTLTLSNLDPNTTFYFRAGSININNATNYATSVATSTLANPPDKLPADFIETFLSSVTAQWVAAPISPSTSTTEGYLLEASSTNFDGTGSLASSSTAEVSLSTLSVFNLSPNTTYFFRVGSLNWHNVPNYTSLSSTSTLANTPTSVSVTSAFLSSVTLSWNQPAGNAEGYRLEASSTNFNGTGALFSSSTFNGNLTSLTVFGLLPNTTYFFRTGSLNWNSSINFDTPLSTSTLANTPQTLARDFVEVNVSSITAQWVAFPNSPPEDSSEGYRLDASSTNFNGSGTIFSSATSNVILSTLTVPNLNSNTTYFFRVASLNWNGSPHYTTLSATSTLASLPATAITTFTEVNITSITTQWTANSNPTGTQYTLRLSTVSDFSGTLYSSTTLNLSATITGLAQPNTTTYAQIQAINNNGVPTAFTSLGSTVTHASPPGSAAPVFDPVNISSLTVHYSNGSPVNPPDTLYQVQVSSNVDYTSAVSSTTMNFSATLTGLSINTTYYARAQAQNRLGVGSDYTEYGSTPTLAVSPGPVTSTFTSVTSKAVSFTWSSGTAAGGFDPTGTLFHAQISDVSNFATITAEANTTNLAFTFSGLASDTIYYVRVRALNHQSIPTAFMNYGSTRTVASSLPAFITGTFDVTNSQGQYINGSLYTDTTTPNVRIDVRSSNPPGLSVTDTPSMLAIWHLDEGAGATSLDASRHNNDLSLQGSPTWVSGRIQKGLDFDGISDYAINSSLFPWRSNTANNVWTMELWFKAGATEDTGYLIQTADQNTPGGVHDGEITWDNTTGFLKFNITDNRGKNKKILASSAYDDGAWHYAAIKLDNVGFYLYVDGIQQAFSTKVRSNKAQTYSTGADFVWVGAGTTLEVKDGNGSRFFGGVIDEVRLSKIALTGAQILENYNMGLAGHEWGAPDVDVSTQSGTNFSWVRLSTTSISVTGANGTTLTQTLTANNLQVVETESPGALTNQVAFFATDLDSGLTTAQYTILVDTTPPTNIDMSSLMNPTTYSITATALTATDPLSGLNSTPYLMQASADSSFSVILSSSDYIGAPSFEFTSLDPNTTTFFRVQARDKAGNHSGFSSSLSSATLAVPVQNISVSELSLTSATFSWAALPASPSSSTAEGYRLESSTTNFDGTGVLRSSSTAEISITTLTLTALSENTTTYFRVGSLNWNNIANFTSAGTTSTLANSPDAAGFASVYFSSATVSWTIPSGGSEGYQLEASTVSDFSGTVHIASTTNGSVTQLTVEGLALNTTTFFRVGSINWNNRITYATSITTSTLAGPPTNTQFLNVFITSAALTWNAPAGGAAGYQLDASTSSDFFVFESSVTTDGLLTTLTVSNLNPNTTTYFRVGSKNWNDEVIYASSKSTSTLTHGPANLDFSAISLSSISVTWNVPTGGAEGYRVETSTASDFTGTLTSSNTTDGEATGLTVFSLNPNVTYYFRIGAQNWNDVVQYATAGGTSTLTNIPGSPSVLTVFQSSVTATWSIPVGNAEGYQLDASTSSGFTALTLSSITQNGNVTSLTAQGLLSDTTYFFRVGSINWNDVRHYTAAGSTKTLLSVDTLPPDSVLDLSVTTFTANSTLLKWTGPFDPTDNPLSGNYAVQYATWTGVVWSTSSAQVIFSTSNVNPGDPQGKVVAGLNPNTTYYFKLWTSDLKPNWSEPSNQAAEATLAKLPANIAFEEVLLSSVSLRWDVFPASPPSESANGYVLEASTSSDFLGTITSSTTFNLAQSTLTISSLDSNTTYYFRAGSMNINNTTNYATALATSTLSVPPSPLATDFISTYVSSITAHWVALPTSPQNGTAEGYLLEASSTNFNGAGVVYSSSTSSVSLSTLTTSNLDPNIIYYFRVGSLNWQNVPNYTTLQSTSSLANTPTSVALTEVFVSSASLSWNQPAGGSEGYLLEASSTNFDGTGTSLSSSTTNGNLTALSVSSLLPNTTYFFRTGSLNWDNAVNFASALSTSTLTNPPQRLTSDFVKINISSITAQWVAFPGSPPKDSSEGYRLEASSTNFDGFGTLFSSATPQVTLSTLAVVNLIPNTTYFFKVGGLNWNNIPSYIVLSATSTLANPPGSVVSTFTAVDISSITTQWTANFNPTGTQFTLELSTAQNFTGTLASSTTPNLSASLTGLDPNATYYARVRSTNHNGVHSAFTSLGSTVTRASPPGVVSPAFNPVNISSLTVHYSSGSPVNPPDTSYQVQLSPNPDYSGATSSTTVNLSATYMSLSVNTTYFARVRAQNREGVSSEYTAIGSTATLAVPPGPVVSTFTSVTGKTVSFTWSSGTVATGFNPTGTLFNPQISDVSNFATLIAEANTTQLSHTFTGLASDTIFYLRVRTFNHQNIETTFTNYGSTRTSPSSLPTFIGGTFEVTNSQGIYIDPSLYTDTTTPNVRVKVQSSNPPGLAVTDTPSDLAIWHLDEGAGTLALDASRHNNDLTLQGPPTWTAGRIQQGLDFDGVQDYAINSTLFPWRSNAANNVWTMEFWFKAGASEDTGYVIQTADQNTAGGKHDGEITWDDTRNGLKFNVEDNGGKMQKIRAASAYDNNIWHYVAMVLDANGFTLYVDGQQKGTSNKVKSNNAKTYASGADYIWVGASTKLKNGEGHGTRFYSGRVDEIRLSNVALTVTQIQGNYNLGLAGHGFGAPELDVSTQSGADFTWVRLSSNSVSVTGANGSTAQETFTANALSLVETESPGAQTNRVTFLAADVDGGLTQQAYTILVDTTAPTNVGMSSLTNSTTFSIVAAALTAVDPLSGLDPAPYLIEASTDSLFTVLHSSSDYIATPTFDFTGLNSNTTYFFRARARDKAGNKSNFSSPDSTSTLSIPVQNISITNAFVTSATLTWNALPFTPSSSTAEGYLLEASSTNFDGTGDVLAQSTDSVSGNTLTVASLLANTTYFFRVGSLNWNNIPNTTAGGSTSTLANVPGSINFSDVFITSATLAWNAPARGSEGYRLEASTISDFSAALISSSTTDGQTGTLSLFSLNPNTTYYFRVGAVNWNGLLNYADAGSTSTLTHVPQAPSIGNVFISSVSLSWTGAVGGAARYRVEASTASDFSGTLKSSQTTLGSETNLTVENLSANTTYFFRVGSLNWNNIINYENDGSTSTRTNAPVSPTLIDVFISSASFSWTAPVGGAKQYRLEASTASDFTGTIESSTTLTGSETSLSILTLSANTTTFFRVGSLNWNDQVNFTAAGSTSTLTNVPTNPNFTQVFITSASVSWTGSAGGAARYQLDASTALDFSGPLISSTTTDGSETSLLLETLSPNTTYHFRVGSLNWNSRTTFSTAKTTSTLTNEPANFSIFAVSLTSVTATWNVPAGGSVGYRLDASTSTDFSAPLTSSGTAVQAVTTLTLEGLSTNTTYYLRAGSINHNNILHYTGSLSTATLAGPPQNVVLNDIVVSSATLSWNFPPGGASGYQLDASTVSDFSGPLESSSTTNGSLASLTVLNLAENTTYYFRVGSINHSKDIIYAPSLSSATLANFVTAPAIGNVFVSSMSVSWGIPAGGAEGYRLQASTHSDFSNTIVSSVTTDGGSTSLTVQNLNANTTYYVRVGAVNWNNIPHYASGGSTSTLSVSVTPAQPAVLTVYPSSVTVQWDALPSSPEDQTSEGYVLRASSTNFDGTGTVYSSSTALVSLSTLTVDGLNLNTTYYFEVGSLNWNDVPHFITLQASSTLAGLPVSPAFVNVFVSSATATWGAPANGSEGFTLEASTQSDFSGTPFSSSTADPSLMNLTVFGLTSDTTYHFRVGSLNWNQVPNYATVGTTQTLTSLDVTAPAAITDLTASTDTESTVRLTWSAPEDLTDNPLDGTYLIQYATWTGVAWSTDSAQVNFSTTSVLPGERQGRQVNNLDPNTTHFFRIWTQDIKPNTSPLSNGTTETTLANIPQNTAFNHVSKSSVSVLWTAFPVSPSSATSNGYVVETSTNLDFSGTLISSVTTDVNQSVLSTLTMDNNTTYYFRVGSLNWKNAAHYASTLSTSTLSTEPVRLPVDTVSTSTTSITAQWVALPASPPNTTSEGYRLIASSTNFNGTGLIYSSQTANVSLSTLTLSSLEVNTTYYMRVGSLNWLEVPNFTILNATSTLANPPATEISTFTSVTNSSVTVQWLANNNPTGTRYELELSTASNFVGTNTSSSTNNLSATVENLTPSTSYFARARAINHENIPTAFTTLGSTRTSATPPGAGSPVFSPVNSSSLTVHFTAGTPPNPAEIQYTIEVSTDNGFSVAFTSVTSGLSAPFSSLNANTTYYARGKAENGAGRFSGYTDLGSTVTLAVPPGPAVSTFTNIGNRSFLLNWSSGTAGSGTNAANTSYTAEISTASDFSGGLSQNVTSNLSTSFSGLDSGTTYYARVKATNFLGIDTVYIIYGQVTTSPTSEVEFQPGTFQVSNSLGQYISPSLYTDTTTPNVRVDIVSHFPPGLAVSDTPSQLTLWHLNDGSGSNGIDSSLHGNDLTLYGSPLPTWSSGFFGKALDFDGSQNYAISSTNLTPFRSSSNENAWTVEFWFKTASASGYLFQMANTNTASAPSFDASIGWHKTSGALTFSLRTSGGAQRLAESSQGYADSAWHFVTAVLNSSGMYLYVDGSQVASNTNISASSAKTYASALYAWVGGATQIDSNMSLSKFANAFVDDVRLSTVAFSASQVGQSYSLSGTGGHPLGDRTVDVSTEAGGSFTWVRISTKDVSISGSNGSTSIETVTGTQANVVQSTSAGAPTNQVMILATSIDGNLTTAQYTILVDTTSPTNVGLNSLTTITTDQITVNLLTASDPLSGLSATPYLTEVSTDSGFSIINSSSDYIASTTHLFTGLVPNTSYYIRAYAQDSAGNLSSPSATVSSSTLSLPLSNPSIDAVFPTSATVSWTGRPVSPSSDSAEGYLLEASSTNFNGTGDVVSTATANLGLTSLSVLSLRVNTTYFFRVGSLNHEGFSNAMTAGSTSTLTNLPTSPAIANVYASSITVTWGVPLGNAEGYRLEASTRSDYSSEIISSTTNDGVATSLSVVALDANTTYYLRVGAINWNNLPRYAPANSTSTLATSLPRITPDVLTVYESSITLRWAALPSSPQNQTSEGYRLIASSTNFSGGGTLYSTSTTDISLSTLTVQNLDFNTTYYFRAGTLNWNNVPHYITLSATSSLAGTPGSPNLDFVYVSSVTASWTLPPQENNGFLLEASTASDFTGTLISSSTDNSAETAITILSLLSNTTYHFRVGSFNWNHVAHYAAAGSTKTLSSLDVTAPDAITDLTASSDTATRIQLSWSAPLDTTDNPLDGTYFIEYSSVTGIAWSTSNAQINISTSGVNPTEPQGLAINNLMPNTTYFFRIWTQDIKPNTSGLSNGATVATLANVPNNVLMSSVQKSSVTLSWAAFATTPSSSTAEGYLLQASTASDFSGNLVSSQTTVVTHATLSSLGLDNNTTYYFRVGSLNWVDAPNFTASLSTSTLATEPVPLSTNFIGIYPSSVTAQWTELPATPEKATAEGFRLEASSTNFNGDGVVLSSETLNVGLSTLTVDSLSTYTTYYFRVVSLNWNNVPNTMVLSATSTLANVATSVHFVDVYETSATLNWNLPAGGAGGYRLEASSASDYSPPVFSSTTYDGTMSTLTVTTLVRNTTFFFRVGSLNFNATPNFAATKSTSTLAKKVTREASDFLAVDQTSVTAHWIALPTTPESSSSKGYLLETSSTNFDGTGVVFSSETTDVSLSTLTVLNLGVNVTYYFRVGSLNANHDPNDRILDSTVTLAKEPGLASPNFTMISISSLTVQWLANGNADGTLYQMDFSSASDFSGTLLTSTTYNLTATKGGLTANTTYFARARAINHGGTPSAYTTLGSTMTSTSQPGVASPAFSPVYSTSATVNFTAGTPPNPDGTTYIVEISTDSGFGTFSSSETTSLLAGFINLSPNTTYFSQIKSRNELGKESSYVNLGSTSTLAVPPGPAIGQAFTSVNSRGFTLNWSSGTGATGYNPANTTYNAQISTASDFTGTISQVQSTGLSGTYSGLQPGTQYFARVQAMNFQTLVTTFTDYGNVTTDPSSEPSLFNATFKVTDSHGTFIDGTLYTDTTTVQVKVDVQSNFSPGLSVSDTPGYLGLWHLDDGSGSTGVDASLHNNDLTLNGSPTPTWVSGKTGKALDFDGSQNDAVSTDLNPWRTTAADNDFTIEFWFKTASGNTDGYLFQSANTSSASSPNFDGDIGWHNSSGNLAFALRTSGGAQRIAQANSAYDDNTWHYAAALLNSTGMYLYVDGQEVGSNTNISASSAKTYSSSIYAWMGAASTLDSNIGNSKRFSTAQIDEVRISSISFNAAQISRNYGLGIAGHRLGGPAVDLSTSSGSDFTWVRISTKDITVTGSNGTTSVQTITSTSNAVVETQSPGALTNQVMFFATDLDGNLTTAQYTILVDTTRPSNAGISSLSNVTTAQVTVNLQTASDPLSGLTATPYVIQASTDQGFSIINSSSGFIAGPSHTFSTLEPNTTTFFRVRAQDQAGNDSAFSSFVATATLAPPLINPSIAEVAGSSVTLSWTPLPASPSSATAEGYIVHASTDSGFLGTLYFSSTTDITASSLSVTGLSSQTTYYFKAGTLNWLDEPNFTSLGSTETIDALPPSAITDLASAQSQTGGAIDLSWTAPGDDESIGIISSGTFVIQYTTDTPFAQGSSWSPTSSQPPYVFRQSIATSSVIPGTLHGRTLSGLTGGNTYYFRAWTQDDAGNYSGLSSGATDWASVVVLSLNLSTHTINFGSLTPGATVIYNSSITVTNIGNVTSGIRLAVTEPATWQSTTSATSADTYRLTGVFKDVQPGISDFSVTNDVITTSTTTATSITFAVDSDPDSIKGFHVNPGETRTLWIRIEMPPISSTLAEQIIRLNATALKE